MRLPPAIRVREVAPRDGLQGEPTNLSTQDKVALVDLLSTAGFPQINVTSFVSPKAVPHMADASEVMARIQRREGVTYDVSVPNVIGAERAIAAGADCVVVFVSASETANRHNVRRSVEESMREAERVIAMVRDAGLAATGTVAAAFGCSYEGGVPPERVLEAASRFVAAGATGVALGDTSGEGTPRQVADLTARVIGAFGGVEVSLHLHDTRGYALANVLAAMDAGVTSFDAAVGGIGGSPFTRDAAGNVPTEALVHMCDELGIATGVDFDVVLEAYRFLEDRLGHPLPGKVGRVGRTKSMSA